MSARGPWAAIRILFCLAALAVPVAAAPVRQVPQAQTGAGSAAAAAPSDSAESGGGAAPQDSDAEFTPRKGVKRHPWGNEIDADLRTERVRPIKNDAGRQILVITPPAYDDARCASVRYPVFYLLHGSPGKPSNFINFGHWPDLMQEMVEKGVTQQAIFVIPDGNYAGEHHGDSEWANSADGRDQFESYVTKDVVSWADANLRTIPDAAHRVLVGVSEGGYGAVNIAMREPGVFGAAVSLSGYFRNDGSGWARPVMGYDPERLRQYSPLDYVSTGLGPGRDAAAWRGTRFFLGAGDDEQHYVEETRQMAARMKDAGLDVTLRVERGKHGWGLWDQLFQDAVPLVLSPEREPAGPESAP